MDIKDAIRERRSIRGFKSEPVPEEIIKAVLDLARLAPSATNCQPWKFIVLNGDALARSKRINEQKLNEGAPISPDFKALPPNKLPSPYVDRQNDLARGLFGAMGIERDDRHRRKEWQFRGKRFFDAPAAIIVCVDEGMYNEAHHISLLDIGIITQTIALAALEYGLGTCIQQDTVFYPDELKEALGIPDSKKLIVAVDIGYPDWDFPANSFKSDREPIDSLAEWMR
ncbi:MAG: nitroreductase [Dehalococcoidia bacterium]